MSDPSHRFLSCALSSPLNSANFLFPLPHNHPKSFAFVSELPPHYALRSHATSRTQLFPDGPVSCFFLQTALLLCSPLPLLPGIHVCLASPGWNSLPWCCVRVSVDSKFTPYLVPFTEGIFRSLSMALLLWFYLLHLSLRHIPHLSGTQFLYPLFSLLSHIGPHFLTMIRSSGCFTSSMAAVTSTTTQSVLRSSLVTVWALPHPPITTAGPSCGHYTERDTDTSRIQPLSKVMLVTNRPQKGPLPPSVSQPVDTWTLLAFTLLFAYLLS